VALSRTIPAVGDDRVRRDSTLLFSFLRHCELEL